MPINDSLAANVCGEPRLTARDGGVLVQIDDCTQLCQPGADADK